MAKKEVKTLSKKEKNSKDKTSFFKGFKAELKKVSWPTPKQLVNNTVAVVVIVLILAAIVFVLDFTFEAVNKYGIDKIKEGVISSRQVTDDNSNGESNAEGTENGNTENVEPTTDANTENTQETPAE
ncbi:MAG: preprotein translocase subunit SecE [Clostridia bacterium]|nr:preprotein translocase subunit SecE [Clostridia bacterium]MBP3802071.1 preprotein translocase subunit SecE [Clostridia bacterium]